MSSFSVTTAKMLVTEILRSIAALEKHLDWR